MPLCPRRIFRHCQVALTTLGMLAVAALILALWWVNRNGFAGQWGDKISQEMAQRGIHAEFRSVRFSPLRGLLAKDVVIYHDESHERIFTRIPSLRIDIDRADAMRGDLTLRKLFLKDAELNLPLASREATGHTLTLRKLSGKVRLDHQGRLLLEEGRGTLGGLTFALEVELDQFDLPGLLDSAPGGQSPRPSRRGEFLDAVFAELAHWQFPDTQAPHLEVQLHGSLQDPSHIRTTFTLHAPELSRNSYSVQSVFLAGELHGRHLVVDRFEFSDGSGELAGRLDYDLLHKSGRYELTSGIHLARLLRSCFGLHTLDDLVSVQAPRIEARGDFGPGEDGALDTVAIGRLAIPPFRFLGHDFESLETEFSWNAGDMFLRDLHVRDARGSLRGNVLIKDDDIRYQALSTLPVAAYDPFIEDGSGLDRTISRAAFREDSKVEIEATGWMQRSNLKNWSSKGTANLARFSYNEVALNSVQASFSIDSKGSSCQDIKAVFDYRNYPPHKRHGGPAEALVEADRIGYDRRTKLTEISNLRGQAWPGPVLRLFAPKTAAYIERTYGVRRPPSFSANGKVDQREPRTRTDVQARVRIPGITDYEFLGEPLKLQEARLRLRVRRNRVDVNDLSFRTFRGTGGGNITVFNEPGTPARFEGGLQWTRLHLAEIGRTYGFEKAEQGLVTGRFDFRGAGDSVRALNGQGALGLENGHLFFVPVLGPLSAPLGEILGDKRASHEEARDASCTFAVKDGVFHTSDFLTSTPSSVFTGEGNIDLDRRTIDMTIRMNARGLLGLLTLPLRPFNGLFQFRGTGPLDDPVWRNSSFTTPARGKDDPIFRKPGKAQIVPDP